MLHGKIFRRLSSSLLAVTMAGSLLVPAVSAKTSARIATELSPQQSAPQSSSLQDLNRSINSELVIDDNAAGGYEGDYVVIYNPATSYSTSYSTGTMTGLIQTSVNPNAAASADQAVRREQLDSVAPYKIDIDAQVDKMAQSATVQEAVSTRASYNVGSTKTFSILSSYSPTGSGSVQFKCLYVGQHCYIWTPSSSANNTYPLDWIDETYAKLAADEFDSKFDLMQSSFGNHTNGSSGDGKLHILYYNIDDGWQPGQGYVAGFFYRLDISNNGLPILNIDTYPGVYYKNSSGNVSKSMNGTYNTMVHEYQHLINYSNTSGMSTWLNESFSAAAEEICYPGSSVVSRIQAWENYYYSDNNDWLNPPAEFEYTPSFNLHNGYSMYNWNSNLDDVLALYGQVSLFSQYLYSRFGNTIYKQISNAFSSSESSAITSATGVNCADLVRDFRIALTANAVQSQYNGRYGFKAQSGYNPSKYHNVQNPYDLLGPVVFTGSSCSIKGGGAITVKPVNGVYNPPADASANLKYYGIKLGASAAPNYTVTATSNNTSYGTVSVNGNVITASPKTGYYASGYTVTSGSATVSQNGNTFTVTPASDCTVRINFAAKATVTVTCMANGSTYTTLTPYSGESFTLPSTATAVSGYSFVGWSTATVSETATQPSYYAPGASVSASSNVTVYAVYTRTASGGGSGSTYTLVSSSPADWSGNYVITYGASAGSMYALKGLSGNVKYESSSSGAAVLLSNTGMSNAGNALSGVTAPYIFEIAPNGSKYTIRSSSTGSYVASYSSYLYSRTNLETNYCLWSLSCSNGNMTATNSASSSYPNLSFASSKYFMLSSSAPSSLRFWKQGGGSTTYYTTSPSAASPDPEPVTTYTVSFSVPSGVSSVASQTAAADSYITLPTAGAPSGYTFLGWVTSAVSSTTTKPTVLTGSYKVTDNITLRALYSYTTSSGSAYQLLGSAPADWNGKYVITYGTNTGSMYVLKGLSGNASYESSTSGGAVLLSNTGMSYANGALSGATDAYIFNVAANGSYYTIQNSATGSYLANYNSYLYSRSSYESAYSRWTLSCSNQNMTVKNAASSNYPYLSFYNGTKYFMMNSSVPTGLYFWKQSAAGTGTTYYTTG